VRVGETRRKGEIVQWPSLPLLFLSRFLYLTVISQRPLSSSLFPSDVQVVVAVLLDKFFQVKEKIMKIVIQKGKREIKI
jgi:hypothetical protein